MELENTYISCGVDQLYGLRETKPKIILEEMAQDIVNPTWGELRNPPAFVIFSDAAKFGNGRRLAKYITDHKLGKVYATQPKLNLNSKNKIQVWTWSVDFPAVLKHTGVKPEEEADLERDEDGNPIYW